MPRHKRSLAISTVRSWCFNEALHQRVVAGSWNQLCDGDKANLAGSASVFDIEEIDSDLRRRCDEMDIHPAGELPGEGSEISNQDWQEALNAGRVEPGWRSLRLSVPDLEVHAEGSEVTLSFSLGRGAFATSLLREIAEVYDAVSD